MAIPKWALFVILLVVNVLHFLTGDKIFPDGTALWIAASIGMSMLANFLAFAGNPILPKLNIPKIAVLLMIVAMNGLHSVVGFKLLPDGSRGWIVCSVIMAILQNALGLLGVPLSFPGQAAMEARRARYAQGLTKELKK